MSNHDTSGGREFDLSMNAALIPASPRGMLTSDGIDTAVVLDYLGTLRSAIENAPDLRSKYQAATASNVLRTFLENVERGSAIANAASAVALLAERRLGQMLSGLERAPGWRRDDRTPFQAALDEIGVSRGLARRWMEVAHVSEDVFDDYVEPAFKAVEASTTGQAINCNVTRNGLLRSYRRRAPEPASVSQFEMGETILRDASVRALGDLDMVPDPESDVATWRGRVLVHPIPDQAAAWASACNEGWSEGRIEAAILRLPLRLDAEWWLVLADHPVCILRPAAIGRRGPTAGVIFGLGVPAARLAAAFGQLGWTYAALPA